MHLALMSPAFAPAPATQTLLRRLCGGSGGATATTRSTPLPSPKRRRGRTRHELPPPPLPLSVKAQTQAAPEGWCPPPSPSLRQGQGFQRLATTVGPNKWFSAVVGGETQCLEEGVPAQRRNPKPPRDFVEAARFRLVPSFDREDEVVLLPSVFGGVGRWVGG